MLMMLRHHSKSSLPWVRAKLNESAILYKLVQKELRQNFGAATYLEVF